MRYFDKETFAFLRELAGNNDRGWFAENKDRYGESVKEPFLQFSNGRMFWTEALDRIFVVYEYGYLEGNNYIQIRTWHSYEDTF